MHKQPLLIIAGALLAAPFMRADTINYSGGVVTYNITTSGVYDITATGAQGGNDNLSYGGAGAEVGGSLYLTAGDLLQIAVGGQGATGGGYGTAGDAPGGGGGSFVVLDQSGVYTPLIIAGGGGGAGYGWGNGAPGQEGSAGTDGGSWSPAYGGAGGTNGNGGGASFDPGMPTSWQAGGGAGYLSNGGGIYGGSDWANGLVGGPGGFAGAGGFGGGGGGGYVYSGNGGGGGGYSGGGGGDVSLGGGGGGSYFTGLAGFSPDEMVATSGENYGNGVIIIDAPATSGAPDTASTAGLLALAACALLFWRRRSIRSSASL